MIKVDTATYMYILTKAMQHQFRLSTDKH